MNEEKVAISRQTSRRLLRGIANFLRSPVGGKARLIAMAFATLGGAFSLVITQFQAISSYASVIARLGEFADHAEKCAKDQTNPP